MGPISISVVLAGIILAALFYFVRGERVREVTDWRKRGVEGVNRLAGNIGLVFSTVELSLITVARDLEVRSDENVSSYWRSQAFSEKLSFSVAAFRNSLRVSAYDLQGNLTAISTQYPAPVLSLGGSEFFQTCRVHEGLGVLFVGPVRTSWDGSNVLVFCKVVRVKAGGAIGVVVTSLRKEFIDLLMHRADQSGEYNYVLVMKDGTGLSSPVGDATAEIGRRIPRAMFLKNYDAAREGLWTESPGTTERLSTDRLVFASGLINGLQVLVGSAVTEATIFRDSTEEFRFVIPAVLALVIITLVLGVLISAYNQKTIALLAHSRIAIEIETEAKRHAELFAQEKSRFYSLVSHDIRTPLMAIRTATELLRLSKDSEVSKDVLNVLSISSAQLYSILESVLTVNAAEVPEVNMSKEVFSPRQMLYDLIETCRMANPSAEIVFQSLEGPAFPEFVFGRKNALAQAVLNIVTNAIKYSGSKSISVSLSFQRVMSEDLTFRISVIDQGTGMSKELLERLFLPHARGDQCEKLSDNGLGLGLWIAQRLVASIQGRIEVESEIGRGSAFHVTATMSRHAPPQATALLSEMRAPTAAGLRVLLAENSSSIRLIVASFLKTLGHTAIEAKDGTEAIELHRLQRFDVVIADLDMPGVNGFDLVGHIRNTDEHADVPIIILTGTNSKSDADKVAALNIQSVLQKPVSLEEMQSAISAVINPAVETQSAAVEGNEAGSK